MRPTFQAQTLETLLTAQEAAARQKAMWKHVGLALLGELMMFTITYLLILGGKHFFSLDSLDPLWVTVVGRYIMGVVAYGLLKGSFIWTLETVQKGLEQALAASLERIRMSVADSQQGRGQDGNDKTAH